MTWFLCILVVIGSELVGSGSIQVKSKEECLRIADILKPVPRFVVFCDNYPIKVRNFP